MATSSTFKFPPPPTYAEPTIVDEKTSKAVFNPIWLKWFLDIAQIFSQIGQTIGGVQHNNLSGLQGGTLGEFYHLTQNLYNVLNTGETTVIVTAALSGGGTQGSMTFINGILTSDIPAT